MSEFTKQLVSSPWYWITLILCIIVIFICIKCGNQIIGWFGEHWTKKEINKLDKNKYHILNDIMIKVNDKTYQIDHIIVSCYGIFVIETKQYNGLITGDKYDKNWVRHQYSKKWYYTNPIRQNYGHVKAISELLNISDKYVYNIVCVTSKAKLNVTHDGELVRTFTLLEKIYSYKDEMINNIDEIITKINSSNITNKEARQQHINTINLLHSNDKNMNNYPKCGGQLVEREGKYGKFIGCSNYPKCKYTRKMK